MQIRYQKKTWKMMQKESQNGAQIGTNILEHLIKKTCPKMLSKLCAKWKKCKGSKRKWRIDKVGAGRHPTEWVGGGGTSKDPFEGMESVLDCAVTIVLMFAEYYCSLIINIVGPPLFAGPSLANETHTFFKLNTNFAAVWWRRQTGPCYSHGVFRYKFSFLRE